MYASVYQAVILRYPPCILTGQEHLILDLDTGSQDSLNPHLLGLMISESVPVCVSVCLTPCLSAVYHLSTSVFILFLII